MSASLTRLRVVVGRLLAFQSVAVRGHVRYLGRGSLFVRSEDARGRYVCEAGGVTQPNVASAWLAAIGALRPDVAVDVGANYGEIVLLGRYGPGRRCVAIEANPAVAEVLGRSVATHRSRERIEVVECAATAATSSHATLYVDPAWSGTTTLVPSDAAAAQEVPAAAVDDIVGSAERVVMKIDVEGGELGVLEGAERLLAHAAALALIVECNEGALEAGGASAAELVAGLGELGPVYRLTSNGLLRPADGRTAGKADLVVFRGTGRQFARFRLVCFIRAVVG